ncbi:hypothetical protein FB446DRAFT_685721 [Lentinula raphanica]|nr:hypothetical protein FB446DRAFT_685721 [Lentinula raphanica]
MILESSLEELQLIKCSLLPTEIFFFLDHCNVWEQALDSYASSGYDQSLEEMNLSSPTFHIGLESFNVWFEATLHLSAFEKQLRQHLISVKGENISRDQQEDWQRIIEEKLEEIGNSEYPIYQLFTLHLLPLLHEGQEKASETSPSPQDAHATSKSNPMYHALFTSHHLVSPTKRRNLQQWSSSLSCYGFAKVGYPGVIYVEGIQENIEEFVDKVKAMQWLALKLRFMEPVPKEEESGYHSLGRRCWTEFQKVGEVMEEMRSIGRERYIVEMGIGSAGTVSTR